jgi:type IV pilus assembly protein PilQ
VPPTSTAANFPAAAPAITGFAANPFALALGYLASNFALDIQIQALEGEGRARVISRPSVTTLDNEPATIASGIQFPIISVTSVEGAQQASVQFKDITTRLQVTPRVIPGENKLQVELRVKRQTLLDVVQAVGLSAPIVASRDATTSATIPDGGTLVIGGLPEDTQRDREEGVPWLRKIPVLGWLFKNTLAESRRQELVVFLTARTVQNPGQAAVPGLPGAPGAPLAPGPQGRAPEPAKPLPAVSSAAPSLPAPARPTFPVTGVGDR